MKFIHAADVHLDSPLCGLARYEGAPVEQMQSATRRAFVNLIDLACIENIDFMVLAGDLYDTDWKDYNTGLFFHQQMSRLREADIPVFLVFGNHDAGSTITRQLRLPENVHEFSTRQPQTFCLESIGVALHGQSFADRSVTDDLSAAYPPASPGLFNIGVLHTAVNGRPGHDNYAPCTINGLLSHGYDYWALGHVHKREILHEQPWIVFPGNLQGRHARETGAKGCTLVNVDDNGQVSLTPAAVDVLRWAVLRLDGNKLQQADDVCEHIRYGISDLLKTAEGRPLAVRILIEGHSSAHHGLHSDVERWINEIRATATDVGLGTVWVEKVQINTLPPVKHLPQTDGPLNELLDTLRCLPEDDTVLSMINTELRQLRQALPDEARQGEDNNLNPEHPETLQHLLHGVEELLMARLLGNTSN